MLFKKQPSCPSLTHAWFACPIVFIRPLLLKFTLAKLTLGRENEQSLSSIILSPLKSSHHVLQWNWTRREKSPFSSVVPIRTKLFSPSCLHTAVSTGLRAIRAEPEYNEGNERKKIQQRKLDILSVFIRYFKSLHCVFLVFAFSIQKYKKIPFVFVIRCVSNF